MPYRPSRRLRDYYVQEWTPRRPAHQAPRDWEPEVEEEGSPVGTLVRVGMLGGLVWLAWWMWKHWECGKGSGAATSPQGSVPPQVERQRRLLVQQQQQYGPSFTLRFVPEPRDPQVPRTSFGRLELPDGTSRDVSGWVNGVPDLDRFFTQFEQTMAAARNQFPGANRIVVEDYRSSRGTPVRLTVAFRNRLEQILRRLGFTNQDIRWAPTWALNGTGA